MGIIEAIILGLIQGLTEFIPVSSSGHLVILHDLLGVEDGGLAFDVALHIGTLLALAVYFRRDILLLLASLVRKSTHTHLARLLIAATIPAVIAGVVLQDLAEDSFRSSQLVAINLILVGGFMLAAERFASRRKQHQTLQSMGKRHALIVGVAQALAIIPGVSRSGSTMSAGLLTGLDRVSAGKLSFLLAIPITFGATLKIATSGTDIPPGQQTPLMIGIVVAFFSGLFAIRFLLGFVARHSLAAFAYYRFTVGGGMLLYLFFAR